MRSSMIVFVSKGFVSLLDEIVSWCCRIMRPEMRPVDGLGVTFHSRMCSAELETILISCKPVAIHFAIIYLNWFATFGGATTGSGGAR